MLRRQKTQCNPPTLYRVPIQVEGRLGKCPLPIKVKARISYNYTTQTPRLSFIIKGVADQNIYHLFFLCIQAQVSHLSPAAVQRTAKLLTITVHAHHWLHYSSGRPWQQSQLNTKGGFVS